MAKKLRKIYATIFRISAVVVFFIILTLVIAYARGYRPDLRTRSFTPTGILATSSSPRASSVYVNGVLKGVTDLNLTMPPGEYTIEMKKEGYTDWSKKIILKGEIVMSLDGLLFPKNPSLSPVTSLGVTKAIPIDQTDQILLASDNGDLEKDGLYVFALNQRPLSLLPPLKRLLAKNLLPADARLEAMTASFSPDYDQAILDIPLEQGTATYLISLTENNTQLFDIAASKEALLNAWHIEKNRQTLQVLSTFPKEFTKIATDSIRIVAFSPDETKLLYQAIKPVQIPLIINPPLIAASQATEKRSLETNKFYLYDWKEDKNFEVSDIPQERLKTLTQPTPVIKPTPIPTIAATASANESTPEVLTLPLGDSIAWYTDSKHFLINEKREIIVVDYDGGNKRTVYSGPFLADFFTVTRDGKLLVLTNLNPQYNKLPDVYEVGIR